MYTRGFTKLQYVIGALGFVALIVISLGLAEWITGIVYQLPKYIFMYFTVFSYPMALAFVSSKIDNNDRRYPLTLIFCGVIFLCILLLFQGYCFISPKEEGLERARLTWFLSILFFIESIAFAYLSMTPTTKE